MTATQVAGVLTSVVLVFAVWYVLGTGSQGADDLARKRHVGSASDAGAADTEEAASGLDSTAADPSGYPAPPVPTQTTIPPGEGKYDGWTDQEIADDLMAIIDGDDNITPPVAPDGSPPEPTTWIDSIEVTPSNAGDFDLLPDSVSFQSNSYIAMVFSGSFRARRRGLSLENPGPFRYMMLVVDRASGSWGSTRMSNDRQSLLHDEP